MKIPSLKALVPLKLHSERVPGKNIRPLCGKPLFHWIIESLRQCQYIDEIIVNTDSELIAKDAQQHFDVTINSRPAYLLGDMVIANQLIEYDLANSTGDFYLQTHSTNPLLTTDTINKAIESFFAQSEHDSLFTVTPLQTRLYWLDGKPVNHDPKKLIRTQDLPTIYEENSCMYIFSKAVFNERKNRIGNNPMMFPIDRIEAVDIDVEFEFKLAETLKRIQLKLKDGEF
jgi:N-acylneuraminate cytidylyltransferase